MKTLVMTLLIVCGALVAGAIVYLDFQKAPPAPKPVAEALARQPVEASPTDNVPVPPPPQPVAPAPVTVAATPAPPVATEVPENPIHARVKELLSAKSWPDKQKAFDALRKSGQWEAAIADLKQMATENPNDPHIPTTIGEAELNEAGAIKKDGGDYDQMGILAMQADQEFNSALQIDPKNWEAQFVKASMMYYWPANPQFDNQVVQNLSGLIDQQETMPQNAAFAQTYVVLGNEYQKIGQPDKAISTWQLGAQEYPSDPTLQKKLAGGANP
jgi:hypothetical protein